MRRFPRFVLTASFSLCVIGSPWWNASAFALRTLEQGAKAPDIDLITDLYTRCRYAPGRPPIDELKQAVSRFRAGTKTR